MLGVEQVCGFQSGIGRHSRAAEGDQTKSAEDSRDFVVEAPLRQRHDMCCQTRLTLRAQYSSTTVNDIHSLYIRYEPYVDLDIDI